ncbi:hypothetical protein LTR17_020134 [Elasticomyces elasticus]|nr:hypothetical protein LTR17_020134 [Elasticomyces elasticus]
MDDTQDHIESRLLCLTPELRNSIYRFALLESEPIRLTRESEPQPALLRVNRQLRKEAIGIWFSENKFELEMVDMDLSFFFLFIRLLDRYRAVGVRNAECTFSGAGKWANMVSGLQALHAKPFAVFWVPRLQGKRWAVIRRAMEIVEEYKEEDWKTVELVLKGFECGIRLRSTNWE